MATRLSDIQYETLPTGIKFVIDVLMQGKFFRAEQVEINLATLEEAAKGVLDSIAIYTDRHQYRIVAAVTKSGKGCLMGFMGNRSPLPGETWTRGNDLRDGGLNMEALVKIFMDILSCELLPVEPDIQPVAVEEVPTGPAL
ncbi:MAG: hypothetical protein WC455_09890 [Dehalococcoidia bacterium]|jgi:hypothetical protein